MGSSSEKETGPPKLRRLADGTVDTSSAADLLEWFLTYDERTARMRHPNTDELFLWKQQDDTVSGRKTYPFENAEARFAIGAIQALKENDTEQKLAEWIGDLLAALQQSHEAKQEIAEAYSLDLDLDASSVARSESLPTETEKRLYLNSCWIEALCTAEVRFLGWVYQDLYKKPFAA